MERKYNLLINNLVVKRKANQSNYDLLLKTNFRAFKPLVTNLHSNPDAEIRENCAEILGERKSAKAVPYLIKALSDDSIYVRQDALWSIEKFA